MKILFDIRLLKSGGVSGIEEYATQLLRHLLTLDTQNRYLLFYNGLHKRPLPHLLENYKNTTLIQTQIPNRLLDASMRFLNHPAIDKKYAADLVMSPHFNYLHVAHAPRIITFHDLSFLHHPDFFSRRQRLWHSLQDFKRQAEKAQRIIAVSEFTKYDLVKTLGIPEEKITVITSGIDPTLTPLPPNDRRLKDFRHQYNLPYPFILSLGTIEPRKNTRAIVRAFNIVKSMPAFQDLRLVIAGKPGWLYHTLFREIQDSPYRDHIIFWGKCEPHDKLLLYNLAETFVYPSFFEGFGFPPLEAQACGTPVIVGNRTSLPEIVGNAGIYVDPWRVDELAEALKNLLLSPTLKEELKTQGAINVSRFSWQKTARETIKLFEEYA